MKTKEKLKQTNEELKQTTYPTEDWPRLIRPSDVVWEYSVIIEFITGKNGYRNILPASLWPKAGKSYVEELEGHHSTKYMRKYLFLLNQEQFNELVDYTYIGMSPTRTIGMLGAPGFGWGWTPAYMFESGGDDYVNAYVYPFPAAISTQLPEVVELLSTSQIDFEGDMMEYFLLKYGDDYTGTGETRDEELKEFILKLLPREEENE